MIIIVSKKRMLMMRRIKIEKTPARLHLTPTSKTIHHHTFPNTNCCVFATLNETMHVWPPWDCWATSQQATRRRRTRPTTNESECPKHRLERRWVLRHPFEDRLVISAAAAAARRQWWWLMMVTILQRTMQEQRLRLWKKWSGTQFRHWCNTIWTEEEK